MYPARSTRLFVAALEDRCTPSALDLTFGSGGISLIPIDGRDTLAQSVHLANGKVLSVARSQDADANPFAVLSRINPDGSPDASFGGGGAVTVGAGDLLAPFSTAVGAGFSGGLAVGPDGSIVVATSTRDLHPTREPQIVEGAGGVGSALESVPLDVFYRVDVYKFHADGSPDLSFGTNGKATVTIGSHGSPFDAAAVAADGSIYLVGAADVVTQIPVGPNDPFPTEQRGVRLAHLRSDGSLDMSFGPNGERVFDFEPGHVQNVRLTTLADGHLMLTAEAGTPAAEYAGIPSGAPLRMGLLAARLNLDGSLDTSYGMNGVARLSAGTGFSAQLADVDVLSDGTILGTATFVPFVSPPLGTEPPHPFAFRITAAGQRDTSFGTNGSAEFDTTYLWQYGSIATPSLVPTPDGGAYVIAQTQSGLVVERLKADGQLDTSFGHDGVDVFTTVGGAQVDGHVATDGGLILAGFHSNIPGAPIGGGDLEYVRILPDAAGPELPPAPPHQIMPIEVGGGIDMGGGTSWTTLSADLTGDGTADTITAAGPGGSTIRIVDGATGATLVDGYRPYELSFNGGLVVTTADVDGDGTTELVVAPDVGGSARIEVLAYRGSTLEVKDNFFALDDPNFRGGARVAAADLTGDGTAELVVTAGPGGGPRAAIYDGRGLLAGSVAPPKLVGDFFAFPGADAVNLRNGATVTATDLTGDGRAELVFGAGDGGAPRVRILNGATLVDAGPAMAQLVPVADGFLGGDATSRAGVILTVTPPSVPGAPPTLTARNGATGLTRTVSITADQSCDDIATDLFSGMPIPGPVGGPFVE